MKQSLGAKTLAQPTPVWVVGTYDEEGKANAMTAAWGGICCSEPVCVTVSLRKSRYTYANALARQAFTINVPSVDQVAEADFFGMVSGKDVDKFAATGLTAAKAEFVDAPYVEEFPMVIECALVKTVELGVHTQFIGEVRDVKVSKETLDGDFPDMAKVRPIVYAWGQHTYYGLGDALGKAAGLGKNFK